MTEKRLYKAELRRANGMVRMYEVTVATANMEDALALLQIAYPSDSVISIRSLGPVLVEESR